MNSAASIDDVAAAWVAREDRGALETDALAERDQWLAADPRHRGAYIRAQAVFLRAGRASALGRGFGQEPRRQERRASRSRSHRWLRSLAVAAVLAVVAFGLRPLLMESAGAHYRTGIGQVLRVPLQDGSVMTLNSDTEVMVRYRRDERRVELLRGETLVTVTKDASRPFRVRTGTVDVVAVGTSFSVRKDAGEAFMVLVNEGIVDIRKPDSLIEPVRVSANHAAIASIDRRLRVEPLSEHETQRRLIWREGFISFEGETLGDAAMEFSRYSAVRILIDDPNVASLRVVGVYSSADPEGFATAVAASLGLQVEKAPEGVYLRASW